MRPAAFEAFQERGYAATSTLEIATRARVSKRELYTLVGNKQKMLIAAIGERAKRLHASTNMPALRDRAMLAQVLTAFGARFVWEVSDPDVVAVFRLAIAEGLQAPEVARTLDSLGREASRTALRHIMTKARGAGLTNGSPADMAEQNLIALCFLESRDGLKGVRAPRTVAHDRGPEDSTN